MDIVGYADRYSVRAGDTIRFMVSCERPNYQADVVRLIHGDVNPEGPGFKESFIQNVGTFEGRFQELVTGSHVTVPDSPPLRIKESFTLTAWISSTTPSNFSQGILAKWSESGGTGYGMMLDGEHGLTLCIGSADGRVERISTGVPVRAPALHSPAWYFVAASYDSSTGKVLLYQQPKTIWPMDETAAVVEREIGRLEVAENSVPLIVAGYCEGEASQGPGSRIAGHFNGKIDRPALFGRALGLTELDSLRDGASPSQVGDGLIGEWDFGRDFATDRITDVSGNDLHGNTVNRPTRAMKGHNWTANYIDFNRAPQEYGAIHFHDDDLDDARWDVSFEFEVPPDLGSGVYAARLTEGDSEDYVPFFVRPAEGAAQSKILLLIPTNSYLTYANNHSYARTEYAGRVAWEPSTPQDLYIAENHLNSTYDVHTDGSPVFYSSRLRPNLTMRPKYNFWYLRLGRGGPWQFNGDLHLVDWLDERGYAYDVATDEDLQIEGMDLLSAYNVVVTGSHPEYWTSQGLDAVDAYLAAGGRLMYLGGNGFFSVVSFPPDSTHCIEMRRTAARPHDEAGQSHHSFTGEPGMNWNARGRPSGRILGVGSSTGTGFDYSMPYHRLEDSYDPRAAFIFEGIGRDEVIGNFGLKQGGAGGVEIDRADYGLGTPPHALVLAAASGFSDHYQLIIEAESVGDYSRGRRRGGSQNPLVRSDLVYFEGPAGGGVFSVGSIAWCGSLSHDDYDNNVSRITKNVLDRFASDDRY